MGINPIQSTGSSSANVSAAGEAARVADGVSNATAAAAVKTNDQFMMILLAQLKNQNPLEPMKDNELMAQMTQLNSLKELQSISAKIEQMAGASSAGYAASLIGKQIKARLADGTDVAGLATSMSLKQGQYVLNVAEKEVPVSAILQVTAPPAGQAAATPPAGKSTPSAEVPIPETPANV